MDCNSRNEPSSLGLMMVYDEEGEEWTQNEIGSTSVPNNLCHDKDRKKTVGES